MQRWFAALAVAIGFISIGFIWATVSPRAQSASNDRPNISGVWLLNPDLSDGPQQVDAGWNRATQGNRRGGGYGRGVGGRGGFGGAGTGGYSGTRPLPVSPDDRNKIQAITNDVRNPSSSLTISYNDPDLTITDAQQKTHVFQTNGKKDTHQFGADSIDSTTNWEGNKLVTEYDLGNGRKARYVYSFLPNTKQLVEQVSFQGGQNQGGARTPTVIKHVYDAAPSRAK
jgi:hypothetical protein